MKVAIIGSGIAGLAAAHVLRGVADFTLFEAGGYFGGHTHTVDVTLPTLQGPLTHGVDTGFLVMNERTYPNLIALFKELGVATAKSDMSFSVQAAGVLNRFGHPGTLEWSGSSLSTVFAQRSNLWNWRFLNMLRELLRFNKLATRLALKGQDGELRQSLGDFLKEYRFSPEFYDWYLLPDDERRDILVEHGKAARGYPDVRANTVSSFALGDYEWILAFEADELHRIVDLMRELRAAKARLHVREEVPFYTGPRVEVAEMVASLR